jgi:Dolichyl-phosphate-mannose-protein mannosyltransferase
MEDGPVTPAPVVDAPASPTPTPQPFNSRWPNVVALLLLALMALLAGGAVRRESVVIDEMAHIGAGLSYLQTLQLRLNEEHPPLAKVIAAIPLAMRGAKADYSHISWTVSSKFIPAYLGQWIFGAWVLSHWNDPVSTLWWARLPMLGLTLWLGWAIYRMGSRLGGAWGGLLCLTAFVTTPTFLTFGPLVLTDLPVTLFVVLTLWSMGELWRSPDRKRVAIFALYLAAALLSKFSAVILFAVIPAFALSLRFLPVAGQPAERAELKAWRRQRAWAATRGIGWALLVVYVFYFFFSIRQSTDALYMLGHNPIAMIVRRMLLPFALYLRGMGWVALTASRPCYIFGHTYPHGVWFYFPVVFLLKSTLGFLLLLLLSLVLWGWRKLARSPSVIPSGLAFHWRALWVGFWAFTIVCLLSRLAISIRHFGFSIALMIVFLAPLPLMIAAIRSSLVLKCLLAATAFVLAFSCIVTAVRSYPNYFPFINSLSFGRPAYALVSDSNVDWNQALPEVEQWVVSHNIQKIGIDEYGFSDPAVTVPQAHVWDCQRPAPDEAGTWQILSADMFLDAHNCTWLLHYPREALGGGSMYAVHLPDPIPPPGSAAGPPRPEDARNMLGFNLDIRTLFLSLQREPQRLPQVVAAMQQQFAKQMAAQKAKPKQ